MSKKALVGAIGMILLSTLAMAGQSGKPALDPVQKQELLRLEETWNVLDQVAARVWPGWKGYADVPFLFDYENQTRMLVGHPNPPKEFELVEGVTVRGRKVFLDRTKEVPVKLTWPTSGGGGPIPFGTAKNRRDDPETVWLSLRCAREAGKPGSTFRSEDQILLNIHELFHVYQGIFYKLENHPGNLHYNPDTNYAVYSDMEGQALLKAFQEKDKTASLEFLKDFAAARMAKYKSMTATEQLQEKADDFAEGTARYSEYAAILEIGKHYKPKLTSREDPYFTGFKNIDYFLARRLEELKSAAGNTTDSRGKCYQFGCFQALLLNRFVPGWQKTIPQKDKFLFDIISGRLALGEKGLAEVTERLKDKYDYKALFARHNPLIEARDGAFKAYDDQKGKTYAIDFSKTGEFPHPADADVKSFTMMFPFDKGILRTVYPDGFKSLAVQEVTIEGKGRPLESREIWKIGYIDATNAGYRISASKVENNVYTDAVIVTDGFTLKAPKLELKEKNGTLNIIILSKVKTG